MNLAIFVITLSDIIGVVFLVGVGILLLVVWLQDKWTTWRACRESRKLKQRERANR